MYTVKLPLGFGQLEFEDWARGLIAAVVGGAANAAISGLGLSIDNPTHYVNNPMEFYHTLRNIFFIGGVINGLFFLRSRAIPDVKQVDRSVKTTEPTPTGGKVETEVKESMQVPKDQPIPEVKEVKPVTGPRIEIHK